MVGREPPSRYWPANLTKLLSQREALAAFYNLCIFSFVSFAPFRGYFSFSLNLRAFASLADIALATSALREVYGFV
jgi:hypothetical protein